MQGLCSPVIIVSGCMVSARIAPLSKQHGLWMWRAEGKDQAFFQLLVSCECLSPMTALYTPDCFAVCRCVCVTRTQYAQAHVNMHLASAFPLRYILILPEEWEPNCRRNPPPAPAALALGQPGFRFFGRVLRAQLILS